MPDDFVNLGQTTVATAPVSATAGTTMSVASGAGATFPAAPFDMLVAPVGVTPTRANSEWVRVGAKSGDNFSSMVRAQQGSTARSIVVGDAVTAPMSRRFLLEVIEHPCLSPDYMNLGPGGAAAATVEVQRQMDRLQAVGGTLSLPPGVLTIATNALARPSLCMLQGQGEDVTQIVQSTANVPVIASKNWVTGSGATPTGAGGIRRMTIVTANTGANSHGIVHRDYYSLIEQVVVYSGTDVNAHGILVTDKDQGGTSIGGTLVENTYKRIRVFNGGGKGFYNDDSSGACCTDSVLEDVKVGGSNNAVGGVALNSSAGWQVSKIHTYGGFAWAGLEMNRLFGTTVNDIYVEPGWTHAGIAFYNVQQGARADGLMVFSASTVNGLPMIEMTKQGGGYSAGDGMLLGDVNLVNNGTGTVTGVTWTDTGSPVRGANMLKSGTGKALITNFGGAGASAISFSQVA